MEVQINNQSVIISENASLEQAINAQGIDSAKGVAVAVNEVVVPRTEWGQHVLHSNDKIMIIRATQGG